MTDLKEIPYELSVLLSEYSKLSNLALNSSCYLDLCCIDTNFIEDLSSFIYDNMSFHIKNTFKASILRENIERYLRDTLKLSYSAVYIWENKVIYG